MMMILEDKALQLLCWILAWFVFVAALSQANIINQVRTAVGDILTRMCGAILVRKHIAMYSKVRVNDPDNSLQNVGTLLIESEERYGCTVCPPFHMSMVTIIHLFLYILARVVADKFNHLRFLCTV